MTTISHAAPAPAARADAGRASDVRAYLAAVREPVLDEIRRFLPDHPRLGPILYQRMLEYALREGKFLRPALAIAACRALGGGLEAVLPSAAVLEFYHNAFLIHDDVEDASERRRDGDTLHRRYGAPIAINVGDGMLALAQEPLLDNLRVVGVGPTLRILMAISRMARESAEGQALELEWIRHDTWDLTDEDYVEMVEKKTGCYSFVAPLIIGGIVAGLDDERLEPLSRLGLRLGTAFQIQDDLLNLREEPGGYGKESCGDLWEGKRTLILLHALRTAAARDAARARAILARPRPPATGGRRARGAKTEAGVRFLRVLVERTGSLEYARASARRHADEARRELARAAAGMPPSVHRDFLENLVEFVISRNT